VASGLVNAAGQLQPLGMLAGCRVAAFCGIGNPAGFRHTLAATGCEIAAWRAFPDHHAYVEADLTSLGRMATDSRAEMLICTQKDLVKVRQTKVTDVPLWAVTLEMQFLAGRDSFEQALEPTVRHVAM
jgi:tetraacyldisaccharide 4'-kinase